MTSSISLRRRTTVVALLAAPLMLVSSCSSDRKNGPSFNTVGGSGEIAGSDSSPAGSSSTGQGGSGNGSSNTLGAGGNSVPACYGKDVTDEGTAGGGGACSGEGYEAEGVPIDMVIVMDRSISMSRVIPNTDVVRWDALKAAVQRFVDDPASADQRASMVFFSHSGGADESVDCDPDNYADPDVPMGLLGESGQDIVDAMDGITPGGLTPAIPAVEGAISFARQWQTDNPSRTTVVVFVSDGYPTECGSDPSLVAEQMAAGYNGSPSIRTFVVGVGDIAEFNLQQYARQAGTIEPFVVEETDATGGTDSFVQVLSNISKTAIPCSFDIPDLGEGMELDPDYVRVRFSPLVGPSGSDDNYVEEFPKVASGTQCGDSGYGGWYFDDAANPTRITLCPCTCTRLSAGTMSLEYGCTPIIGIN